MGGVMSLTRVARASSASVATRGIRWPQARSCSVGQPWSDAHRIGGSDDSSLIAPSESFVAMYRQNSTV